MLKKRKYISIYCTECNASYQVKFKYLGYKITCKKCQTKFKIVDELFEESKLKILTLFKNKIVLDFLSSFLAEAQDKFKNNRWLLREVSQNQINSYFENEFLNSENFEKIDLLTSLENKIRITIDANQSITRLTGKVYLIISVIWLKWLDEEFVLTERQLIRMRKILLYFVEIDDFVPDTSPGGYLDDLYVSTLIFRNVRKQKRDMIIEILKKELNQP